MSPAVCLVMIAETPDLNVDKEGDRILICLDGALSLQIGDNRFRLGPGDAVQIPRGVRFGKSSSTGGAHMLLIRGKGVRSFSIYGYTQALPCDWPAYLQSFSM